MNVEKSLFLAALVGSCVAIGNSQPIGDRDTPDNPEVETLIPAKRQKLNRPVHTPPCGLNQYFDQEEGRCLGVPGGGRLIHIDNIQFCEKNTLQPHCSSPQYYYICKSDKTILAKCVDGQHFENRLQRCVYVHPDALSPYSTEPVKESFDQLSLPACRKPGRFPVPDNCAVFYTCNSNGHRLHRSVFKCPENMGFHPESGTCNPTMDCTNRDALKKICVPPAPEDAISTNILNENSESSVDSIPPEESEKNLEEVQQDDSFVDSNVENRLQENPLVPENSKNPEELPGAENIGSDVAEEKSVPINERPSENLNQTPPAEEIPAPELSEPEKLSEVPEVINNPAENIENENTETKNEETVPASNSQPENSNIDEPSVEKKLEERANGEESRPSNTEPLIDSPNLTEEKPAPINERTEENLNQTPPAEEIPQSAPEVTNLKIPESVESDPGNGPVSEKPIPELTTDDSKNSEPAL